MNARSALAAVAAMVALEGAAPPPPPPLADAPPPILRFPANSFEGRVLAVHNAARRAFALQPLVWDPALAAGAAQYAAVMAQSGLFEHRDRRARPGIGENLAMGARGYFTLETLLGTWTAEGRNFFPGTFPNVSRDGNWLHVSHYTQMIWPTTTRIGCALASGRGGDYLVCRYAPKGNVDNRSVGYRPVERG